MIDFSRLSDETELQYEYRICSLKDQIGTWHDVADILNNSLHRNYSESTYRKRFSSFKAMFEANESLFVESESQLKALDQKKREIMEETIRMRDERNELMRIYRDASRIRSFEELILKAVANSKQSYSEDDADENWIWFDEDEESALIVHVTDLHAGIEIKNSYNQYSIDTMKKRMVKYAQKVSMIQARSGAKKACVILGGDLISGVIHTSLRIENNENVIEQVIQASNVIGDFILDISSYFESVEVYGVPGNHSRIMPNKSDQYKGEYLDNLVIYIIKALFSNIQKVTVITKNSIDESVGSFRLLGNLVYFVHGDKDTPEHIVQKLTLMTGDKPDICVMGHRHRNGVSTVYDTKIIESGCVSGPDNYCLDMRLRNKPEQMVIEVNKNGVECVYDVKLDV